ncbi:MAG: N-acetyl-1-D-myo-inositol-2-amino-2-deoxy-alpha-D-glucopyranoside deacetylase [Streptosporangiaceae bacterium]|nr:N-acetyl-1-D-myo-inositol-2-amino-2-deoxy-alpha-D-glucopyranoside deacetylase [Streptosporangiaceae bacterium]
MLVHAHPDDESIGTGATMARYAAEGARVTLVTCTLGERGEVIPPSLAYLADGSGDRLGEYRIGELNAACEALGVTDHRFLGGPGRWRDSGMMGLPDNDDPRCFWQADVQEAALALVGVIREVRPRVIVTYDANGFYGHPDHIQAHRVAWRAFRLAADPAVPDGAGPGDGGRDDGGPGDGGPGAPGGAGPWRASRFYATAMPASVLAEAVKLPAGSGFEQARELPYGVPDDQVTTAIDASAYLDAKLAAMRAHATQIAVDGMYFALSNGLGQRVLSTEYYTLLAGTPGPRDPGDPYERDLFAS